MPLPSVFAHEWLSPHRLAVYTQQTVGDLNAALELYDWNSAVTAACLRDIGHFEVLIRNRYAERLNNHYTDWTTTSSALWSRETGIPSTRQKQHAANERSKQAIAQARRDAPSTTQGHVIAQLTFGFWANLTLPYRESTIWTPILSPVLPGHPRGPHHDRMNKLNKFRNRLAHWEPVFSNTTGLPTRLAEFDDLFRSVDADVATWVGTRSALIDVLDSCPVPHLQPTVLTYLGNTP